MPEEYATYGCFNAAGERTENDDEDDGIKEHECSQLGHSWQPDTTCGQMQMWADADMCSMFHVHFGSMCCGGAAYTGSTGCDVCENYGGSANFTPDVVATYKCYSSYGGEIDNQDDWEGDEAAKVGLRALVLRSTVGRLAALC
jgi:hypothetical protein